MAVHLAQKATPEEEATGAAIGAPRPAGLPSIGDLNKDDAGPTEYEQYLFDLNGYVVLRSALSTAEVGELNASLDAMPLDTMQPGDWFGHVSMRSNFGHFYVQRTPQICHGHWAVGA